METIAAVDTIMCRVHRDKLLMHLDAFYLSVAAAIRLRVYVTTVTCSESLFLDRSKTIFRSGLPTGSLTLTYVPMSSWTSQGHREDRWTISCMSRKTHGRQKMSNARNARHTFWLLIWIFDIQPIAAEACKFIALLCAIMRANYKL